MTYQSIFGLSIFLLFVACGNPQSEDAENETENTEQTTDANGAEVDQPTDAEAEKENKAFQKMVDAHDVVMPRMSEIAEAQLQLREVMEQTNPSDRYHAKASSMMEGLESIHDGMMEWMSSAMVSPDDLRKSKNKNKKLCLRFRPTCSILK